ncbi:transmembrane protein 223-like [Oppia nitens]|uniref:transmembrane protein 223-like n=1 Tax=Oppia nitens TaxID=1686743 RepID=UPI0023DCCC9B|nr:transmembrane protein 223-like [Oppia nitens]
MHYLWQIYCYCPRVSAQHVLSRCVTTIPIAGHYRGGQLMTVAGQQWRLLATSNNPRKDVVVDPQVKKIKSHLMMKATKSAGNSQDPDAATAAADGQQQQQLKATLLYSNERSRHYRLLFCLNILQYAFWLYLANQGLVLIVKQPKTKSADDFQQELMTTGTAGPDSDLNERLFGKWRLLWRENSTQLSVSMGLFAVSQLFAAVLVLYAMRSVRYVILAPGGQYVRFTTFSVTGAQNRYRHYDVPVGDISTQQTRDVVANNIIPVKLKGRFAYFLIDTKKGRFHRPQLFDQIVGVFRILK